MKSDDNEDVETKPSKENHVCHINSGDYSKYRSEKRKHGDKPYTVRFGIRKGDGKAEENEYFYPVGDWTSSEASSHCKSHKGRFEAAKKDNFEIILSSLKETLIDEPNKITQGNKPSQKEESVFHSTLKKIQRRIEDKEE